MFSRKVNLRVKVSQLECGDKNAPSYSLSVSFLMSEAEKLSVIDL